MLTHESLARETVLADELRGLLRGLRVLRQDEALDRTREPFQALNLGTGRGHSVREVVRAVEQVIGRAVPLQVGPRRPGDPPQLVAGPGRAAEVLGLSRSALYERIKKHGIAVRKTATS